MSNPIRIGIAGLGTVGAGLIKIIQKNSNILEARAGKPIKIIAVSALSKSKDRGVDLTAYEWEDDPVALAKRDDIDVFVELIGGESGQAKKATEEAIKHGKHVVTANKAMLAIHGQELASAAENSGVNLRFEAAVAGGIPVIKNTYRKSSRKQYNKNYGCNEWNMQLHLNSNGRHRFSLRRNF